MDNKFSDEALEGLNCTQLRQFLRRHNQFVSGNKLTLIERAKGVNKLTKVDRDKREWEGQEIVERRKTEKLITPLGSKLAHPNTLNCWSQDLNSLPDFTASDIYNYLVLKMNCKRQLRSKVYVEDKHVHSVFYHPIDDQSQYFFTKCKVIPSLPGAIEKNNPDHNVWLCMSKVTGQVHSAECDCTIGMAESCNHIGAFLYTLAAITAQKKEGTILSPTSRKCEWNNPRKRKLSPKKVQDLTFKKTKFESAAIVKKKEKQDVSDESSINENRFLQNLKKCNPKAGWLLNFVNNPVEKKLAQLVDVTYSYNDSVDLKSSVVKSDLMQVFDNMSISTAQANDIEQKTRGQSKNWMWRDQRSNRITSSNFGRVVHLRDTTEPDATVKHILYSDFKSRYTEWGKKHEPAARVKYSILMGREHKKVKVTQCGLMISPEIPYLGTSPDGLISYLDKDDNPFEGLIEIKCPASDKWKNLSPKDCSKDKEFYCSFDEKNDICKLKHSENYYFQIQGQMAISGHNWCDFVVWTLKGISIERIYFDKNCWSFAKQKLENFYINAILPELFSRRVRRGKKLFQLV